MSEDESSKTKIVHPLRSGQITIPAEFRRELGITERSVFQVTLAGGELRIRPVEVRERRPGSPWLREAYEIFAPVREEAVERGYTEEEIHEAIDRALTAVRARHG